MLVLTRRVDERIVIGDEIEVSIVEIKGDQVKIGIDAPRSVQIHRREVFDAIQSENRSAVASPFRELPRLDRYLPDKRPE